MADISNGDYLRILSKVLSDYDINWFSVDGNCKGIRNLEKTGDRWVINDYVGFEEIEDQKIYLVGTMKEICRQVIDYCSYSIDERDGMIRDFETLIDEKMSVLENTKLLSSFKKEMCEAIGEHTELPEVYYHHLAEDIQCFLSDADTPEEINGIYKRINPCTCGGKPELHEYEGMGDGDYCICCKECARTIWRSPYDADVSSWDELLDKCIRAWNDGLCDSDIKAINTAERGRNEIRPDDLKWLDRHPNNMESNGVDGCYSLVFKRNYDGKIYACKWTIEYQEEEIEPGMISSDSKIESYNLFMMRIFEVKGLLHYPAMIKRGENHNFMEESDDTFTHDGVNTCGEFVCSYRTLEEAKTGAASRCGWQGINRDTILDVEQYGDITAEELEKILEDE